MLLGIGCIPFPLSLSLCVNLHSFRQQGPSLIANKCTGVNLHLDLDLDYINKVSKFKGTIDKKLTEDLDLNLDLDLSSQEYNHKPFKHASHSQDLL